MKRAPVQCLVVYRARGLHERPLSQLAARQIAGWTLIKFRER